MAGLKVVATELPGVLVFEPQVFGDARGFFVEVFHQEKYRQAGLARAFVQDNRSRSSRNVLRGLHYQLKHPQGKLVTVITGMIFDVAVDIRRGSATFGKWAGVEVSQDNQRQIYIPEGFAHGFLVLSETADVLYKCTDFYHGGDDYGICWSDREIGIAWPLGEGVSPIVSEKDGRYPRLREAPVELLPRQEA